MTGIVTAVGSFSAKVGTGAQTAVSGLSFQPQAVILWWTVAAGAGWGTDYQEGMGIVGYYNSTYTQAHIAAASKNATATSVTCRHFGGVGDATPQCIYFLQYDQTCLGAAHLTSFDAGGFTLYWDTAGAGAYLIHYMAIGGDLAGSEVLRWQQATSVAPFTQNITTGSFQPDLVFHLCPESNAAPPITQTDSVPSIGAMDTNGNQWALSGVSTHNVSPIRTGRTFSNSACIVRTWPYNRVDTVATNQGMLANGFSVRFTTTTNSPLYYYSLCLKGNVPGEMEVGYFTKPTVIGGQTQTLSTSKVGKVQGILFGSGSTATNGSAVVGHRFSFGGSDGTNHHMLCVTDQDNSNPTVTYKNNATTIAVQIDDNDTQTNEGVGTATLGGANNFQIVWSANTTTTATLIGYIAFGVTAHLDIVSAETATLTAHETSVTVIGILSVMIGGTNISGIIAPSTLGVVDQLDGRNTCQFTTRSATNDYVAVVGNPIQVWALQESGAVVLVFAGIVTDITGMELGDPMPVSGWEYHYKCADYSTYASRHVVAWNYENMSADDIVLHLNQYFMTGEGISAVKEADGGYVQEGVVLKKAVFDYIPVSQALDQLATQCGYSWYVDYYKNLRFFDRATYTAPFGLYGKPIEDACQIKFSTWPQTGTNITNEGLGGGIYNATTSDNDYTLLPSGATAFNFDDGDNNDRIYALNGAQTNNLGAHTWEFCVYLAGYSAAAGRVMSKQDRYLQYISNVDQKFYIKRMDTGGVNYKQWTTPAITLGYHDIQVAWDATSVSNDPVVVIDNVTQTLTPLIMGVTTAWQDDSTGQLYIGNNSSLNRELQAKFLLVRLHDRVLTSDELTQNYYADSWRYTATVPVTGSFNYISLTSEKTQQDYRNRQWIQGGHQISNPRTEKFVGDGKATAFTLQYTVAKTPTITVDGVTQSVGVENVDTNKAWYWSDSSNTINQAKEFTAYEDYCTVKYDFAESTDVTLANKSPTPVACDATAYENNYQAVSSGAGYWRFGDTHDYIKIPHQISIDNVTAHTMEWIVYIGSFQPTSRLWDKTKHIVYIDDSNKNLVIKRFDTGGVKYAQFSTPANTFVAGKVYHIQLEWDCSVVNLAPIVKVNDILQILTASGSGTVTAWAADSSYDAYIGNESTSAHWFDGGFHLFRLWRTSALVPALPTVVTGLLTDDQFHINYLAEMWRYSPDTGMGHPLTSKQTLKVTYQYGFPIIDYVEDPTEQTAQAAKEGEGTGIYEAIYNDGATTDVAWATQEAEALLTKYMMTPETITFYTNIDGLGAGQLITIKLPDLSISGTYLIESVTLNDTDFIFYNYEIVALSGQSHTWSDYFKDMTKAGQKFEIGGDTLILASVNDLTTTTAITCTEAHGTPAHLTTTDATVGFSECLT